MYPTFKELVSPEHLVHALAVIATTGYFVRSARMAYIFNRPVQDFKAAVHHLTLHKASPPVVVTMKNDIGSGNVLHIVDRGFPFEQFFYSWFPWIAAEVTGYQAPGIPLTKEGRQVVHTPL